ncbi:MAG: hypothetical protein AAF196_20150 [Planctomycetota bacterium]
MTDLCEPEPWFLEALPQLGLREGSRVLMLTVGASDQVEAILQRIGAEGSLTIIEPDGDRVGSLERIQHESLTVLHYTPDGEESFGVHDLLLGAPLRTPCWADSMWGDLARSNLRPGGRFLLDLPGERHCAAASEAWLDVGGDEETLDRWNGPNERGLAKQLAQSGLRNVEGFATSHLMPFDSPQEAAESLAVMLGLDLRSEDAQKRTDDLRLAIAKRCDAGANLELVFQRSRITGMR